MTPGDSGENQHVVESAAAVIIGAELLSGKIRDENLYSLSKTLRALGIRFRKVVFCEDNVQIIADEVRRVAESHDVVFTSGGVGPTHDDVTIEGVSRALGVSAVHSPELEALLRAVYKDGISEAHLQMARVPEGATLERGGGIQWPAIVAQNVWILPGVPELFRMKLVQVRARLRGPQPFFTEEVFCAVEETELKVELDEVVSSHPEVEVGSYPKWFDKRYKTRLTFDARSPEPAAAAAQLARRLLGDRVVSLE